MEAIKKLFQFDRPFFQVYSPLWLAILICLILADLGTKYWSTEELNFNLSTHQVNTRLGPNHRALFDAKDQIDILGESGSLLKFRLVFNDRFVFGAGPSAPVVGFFTTLIAVFILGLYHWKTPLSGNRWAWLLVFSGALGNLLDKLFLNSLTDRSWTFGLFPREGYVSGVVDFIEAIWFGWSGAMDYCVAGICPLGFLAWPSWPTFNLADSFIVVGICLLIITMREKEVESH